MEHGVDVIILSHIAELHLATKSNTLTTAENSADTIFLIYLQATSKFNVSDTIML